ncbi:MAG: type III-B CRISPR module RAMP protein Cmr6 [Xenococcaceae cyanobacterium]
MKGSYNNNSPPIWLGDEKELNKAHLKASFIEYLRWMRVPEREIDSNDRIQRQISDENKTINNGTKAQVLQKAVDKAINYRQYFQQWNRNIRLIAGEENTFTVGCAWRVRVGGMRGPEDMLLPAFDARGMPYIPSTTLRGVARAQGVRAIAQEKITQLQQHQEQITPEDWQNARQEAEAEIATYFGSLDTEEKNRAGKVIFLDAYPLAEAWRNNEKGLAVDIANNIWQWQEEKPAYKPNPNLLLSLRKPTFLIGLLPTKHCDNSILAKVKTWLIQGLQAGIGSQVNSGYGEMIVKGDTAVSQPFLQVNFTLTGQLIHSYQRLTWNSSKNKYEGEAEAEVRPIAFKSMLRYWFRGLALGVLPVKEVCDRLEPQLFGSIQPQTQGWLKCQVEETSNPKPRTRAQEEGVDCLSQAGILKLSFSAEAPDEEQDAMGQLFENLTWLMFHLGGVGQGARRPKYSRQDTSDTPPWYRGTQLRATSVTPKADNWWELPEFQDFKGRFQARLRGFYQALARLTSSTLNTQSPNQITTKFREFIGRNCTIVVCHGNSTSNKPFALHVLHRLAHQGNGQYDSELCGDSNSHPSPIWIADLGKYQVVTIFDSRNNKRSEFLRELCQSPSACETLWDSNGLNLSLS